MASWTGEWLTRGSAWLALSLYVAGEAAGALQRRGYQAIPVRWLNSSGCACFFIHMAFSFHFYHHWSHDAAYAETARRTFELTGWNWGGGLYINYVFALLWLGDAAWSWIHPASHRTRPIALTWILRSIFLFMIFNGAFVFALGAMRWFGLFLCLALAACWLPPRARG